MKNKRKELWEADIANHQKTFGKNFVGYGSLPEEIEKWGTIDFINKVIKNHKISSINDIACGFFENYAKKINLNNVLYNGFDIVGETIKENKRSFPDMNFFEFDIVNENLPYADLTIARDIFFHLNNECLSMTLENIKKSKSKFLIATHHRQIEENQDLGNIVGYRTINLEKEPFNLGDPLQSHTENAAGGGFNERHLSLWEIN